MGPAVKGLSVGQRVSGEGHIVGMRSRASRGGRDRILQPHARFGLAIGGDALLQVERDRVGVMTPRVRDRVGVGHRDEEIGAADEEGHTVKGTVFGKL